jgi:hypothetical protein
MIISLYRAVVPDYIRNHIYKAFLGDWLLFKRNFKISLKGKLYYWFRLFLHKTPQNGAYAFIGKYGFTPFPYTWSLKYREININVYDDSVNQLSYLIHKDHRLYFPLNFKRDEIRETYRSLLIEQDRKSAHRYVETIESLNDKVLLDIGVAEGIFSLEAIEQVKKVYIFECEDYWIPALEATFAPWKEKVTIMKKKVSERTFEDEISIDDFMANKPKDNLFLKMDIEGGERYALKGAIETLKSSKNLSCAICTYHKSDDAILIYSFFTNLGFNPVFTDGFILFEDELRKAVLRINI